MTISLRSYQLEALESIRTNANNGIRRQVVHLPTAAGKTVIFASLISQAIAANPNIRVLVLAFSCDLLGQAHDKLRMIDPALDVGIVDANNKAFDHQIVVSSIQSARQPGNLGRLQAQGFTIAICDECHHFASDTARLVLRELGFSKEGCVAGRILIGFSATPFRSDTKGLGEIFDKIVYSKTIKEMIDQGYLARPVGKKVLTDLDLSKISLENGDYSSMALSKVMNDPAIHELIVGTYMREGVGRKAIAFACSIQHSNALAEWFRRFGFHAESIHSQLSTSERENIKRRFSSGEIEILCNPLMLTEGYDCPSIQAVIIARPTKSAALYTQMAGRGLRLFPNKKDCLILDFSDQNHTLCNIGILLEDQPDVEEEKPDSEIARIKEIEKKLPPNLNPKLKKAILDYDLLGESFTWAKDFEGQYYLKSAGGDLKIVKRGADRYDPIMFWPDGMKAIAEGLDFEYAFCAAEAFAKANRRLFSVSDLEAPWRELPISERQKELFHSGGFKNGIDNLTRGQASQLIASGILKRNKKEQNIL